MRILLVRTSALGDIVHCLPVLMALGRQLPTAEIAWVVETPFAELLHGHRFLDRLILSRFRRWRRASRAAATGAWGLVRRLRDFRPDVALDLMGNHKGALVARLSGARRVIGAARPERREPSSALWVGERVATGGSHAVDRALGLLRAMGIDGQPADFGGERLLTAEPQAARRLAEAIGEPFVLVHPGAGWGNKRWPASSWGRLAERLGRRGLAVGVVYGPGEEGLAARVETASGGAARAVEAIDFRVLAGLARRCRLFLAGDTGPLHLAHALGVPVLSLMGPTDPEQSGPYGAPDRALYQPLPCRFCRLRLDEPRACMLDISPRRVAERVVELAR